MSLRSTEVSAPSLFEYGRRDGISEDKWCNICDGLGKYVYAHALRGGNIYKLCSKCHGTGRNPFPKRKSEL